MEPDLRHYVNVIIRRWKLIVAATMIAASAAAGVSLLTPPIYEAGAGLVISRVRSQVVFEPKLETLSDESLNALRVDTNARQNTLVALVRSPAVEAQVIQELGDELLPSERTPGGLLRSGIEGKIGKGELIQIIRRDRSPAKAALIANTWAEAYETHVNRLYSSSAESPEVIESQLEVAWENYQAAELELVGFVGANKITALEWEITRTMKSLAHHYQVIGRAEEMMTDAGSLLAQVEQAGHSGAGRFANGLALLRLQTAALSDSAETSFQLELTFDEDAAILASPGEQCRDIEALIVVLENLREESSRAIKDSSLLGDILGLQKELEEEKAREGELLWARDQAWQTYRALARKADEVNVAAQAVGSEVKFAMPAIEPIYAVAPRKVMNTAVGFALGMVIGILGAFGMEYLEDKNGEPEA